MTTYHQIIKQHKEIKELTYTLKLLIEDQSFVHVETTCKLFYSYSTKVDNYFKTIETSVYENMLNQNDENIKKTVYRFMAGSCGIKRLFNQYRNSWCLNDTPRVNNYSRFAQESEDILKLITQRINDEATYLYPLLMGISHKKEVATV